jgi:transcriptional regulator with XRE-family HTH domain
MALKGGDIMSSLGSKKIFAYNLQHYLDVTGKARTQVCFDLKINYSTFSEWITARKYPRIDAIEKLANYFKIQKSDLIERKDVEVKQPTFLLTDEEKELFEGLRQLNIRDKNAVTKIIFSLANDESIANC